MQSKYNIAAAFRTFKKTIVQFSSLSPPITAGRFQRRPETSFSNVV